jgi:hypothetical protein
MGTTTGSGHRAFGIGQIRQQTFYHPFGECLTGQVTPIAVADASDVTRRLCRGPRTGGVYFGPSTVPDGPVLVCRPATGGRFVEFGRVSAWDGSSTRRH